MGREEPDESNQQIQTSIYKIRDIMYNMVTILHMKLVKRQTLKILIFRENIISFFFFVSACDDGGMLNLSW